jgi:hypothetical protein
MGPDSTGASGEPIDRTLELSSQVVTRAHERRSL